MMLIKKNMYVSWAIVIYGCELCCDKFLECYLDSSFSTRTSIIGEGVSGIINGGLDFKSRNGGWILDKKIDNKCAYLKQYWVPQSKQKAIRQ